MDDPRRRRPGAARDQRQRAERQARRRLNLVKWDLRVQPLRPLPPPPGARAGEGAEGGGGGGFGGGGNNGPFVLPGSYRATLTVDGKDAAPVNVVVKGDSAITITDADRKQWFETAKELHDMQGQANGAAEVIQVAYAQLQTVQAQTRGANVPAAQKTAIESLDKELQALRRRAGLGGGGGFGNNPENVRGRIGQLKGAVMGATAAPTTTQIVQFREVRGLLPKLVSDANATAAKVPALVRDLMGAGVIFAPAKPGQ